MFKYHGELLVKHDFEKLVDVQFVALQEQSLYPNEPSSPEVLAKSKDISEASQISAAGASKTTAYRPPKAREAAAAASGSGSTNGISAMLQQLRNVQSGGPQITQDLPATSAPKTSDPKKASRNQARRERRARNSATNDTASTNDSATAEEPAPAAEEATTPSADSAKAAKGLLKKLRQIEQLKEAIKADPSLSLTPEQKDKLGREAGIREQLKALGH